MFKIESDALARIENLCRRASTGCIVVNDQIYSRDVSALLLERSGLLEHISSLERTLSTFQGIKQEAEQWKDRVKELESALGTELNELLPYSLLETKANALVERVTHLEEYLVNLGADPFRCHKFPQGSDGHREHCALREGHEGGCKWGRGGD